MSAMKRFCEDVSVDMGYRGEITGTVMAEAGRRLGTWTTGAALKKANPLESAAIRYARIG
jgi:hypothetical protein